MTLRLCTCVERRRLTSTLHKLQQRRSWLGVPAFTSHAVIYISSCRSAFCFAFFFVMHRCVRLSLQHKSSFGNGECVNLWLPLCLFLIEIERSPSRSLSCLLVSVFYSSTKAHYGVIKMHRSPPLPSPQQPFVLPPRIVLFHVPRNGPSLLLSCLAFFSTAKAHPRVNHTCQCLVRPLPRKNLPGVNWGLVVFCSARFNFHFQTQIP